MAIAAYADGKLTNTGPMTYLAQLRRLQDLEKRLKPVQTVYWEDLTQFVSHQQQQGIEVIIGFDCN